jgi:LysM repeat protein
MQKLRIIYLFIATVMSLGLFAQAVLPYPLDTIDGQVYYRYTVERSIGLYRISKNFGVSQEEILQANPHLQNTGLRYEEEILIPAKGLDKVAAPANEPVEVQTTVVKEKKEPLLVRNKRQKEQLIDTVVVDSLVVDSIVMKNDSNTIRLALMLPLQADAMKRDKNMDRFYDYYAGALIAINEVQATGQAIEVHTYDVGKNVQKTTQLLCDSTWQKVDAIVGPAYTQQVAIAAEYAQRDSTWMLVPFLSNVVGIAHNPYLLQFNPSEHTEADTLARYLAQYGDSVNCVLIETKAGDVIPSGIMALHQALKAQGVPTSSISLTAILADSLDGAFKTDMENIVIFNTEKYSNLKAVMPHLLQGHATYPITLFSHYSWQNEKIILPQLYTTIFSDSLMVSEPYEAVWQQYFNHTVSSTLPRYDLLGYDQMRHLLQLLQTSADSIATPVWNGLQADIQYHRVSPDGGYENRQIHIIRK